MKEVTVVARTGHMDGDGNYVPDTVTVRVRDGEWAVEANDANEEKAEARGREAIRHAKEEFARQKAQRKEP